MKSYSIAAATALFAASHAATVTLETTKCLWADIPIEQFSIEVNTVGPVAKNLPAICGLHILSASPDIDIKTIQCQAFRDTAGIRPGSAIFTIDNPALISTNPIQEQSILCTTTLNIARRQESGNSTTSTSTSSSTTSTRLLASRASSLRSTTASTSSNSTSSVAPSTIVQTVTASVSSGLPTSSGNATVPANTGRPSATQSDGQPRETTGAAGTVGVGVGVVAAAFAAWLL